MRARPYGSHDPLVMAILSQAGRGYPPQPSHPGYEGYGYSHFLRQRFRDSVARRSQEYASPVHPSPRTCDMAILGWPLGKGPAGWRLPVPPRSAQASHVGEAAVGQCGGTWHSARCRSRHPSTTESRSNASCRSSQGRDSPTRRWVQARRTPATSPSPVGVACGRWRKHMGSGSTPSMARAAALIVAVANQV
jgi:hypothetical protein